VLRATWNSVIVSSLLTGGSMLLCTLAGYAFAKHRFPGRDLLFMALLATMMIPGAVLLVPSFLLFRDFGWLDTWAPLIVPGLAGAFGVFLARQFIEKMPDSLIECARIEGFSEWRTFWSIVLPLSRPLLATLGILTFLGSWNSFLGPLIVLLDERKFTLPLVVAMLQGRFPGKDNMQMAGAMISILPVLVLFFLFQKQIVQSLATSGLKED
jgi:multiple sugar transport system permease protein